MDKNEKGDRHSRQSQYDRNKDIIIRNQMQIVYQCFLERPKTMFEVEQETGVVRPNICRYVQMMGADNAIQEIYKGLCPISNHKAGFYTTNKDLFTTFQPSLFDDSRFHGLQKVGPIASARVEAMKKGENNGK